MTGHAFGVKWLISPERTKAQEYRMDEDMNDNDLP